MLIQLDKVSGVSISRFNTFLGQYRLPLTGQQAATPSDSWLRREIALVTHRLMIQLVLLHLIQRLDIESVYRLSDSWAVILFAP